MSAIIDKPTIKKIDAQESELKPAPQNDVFVLKDNIITQLSELCLGKYPTLDSVFQDLISLVHKAPNELALRTKLKTSIKRITAYRTGKTPKLLDTEQAYLATVGQEFGEFKTKLDSLSAVSETSSANRAFLNEEIQQSVQSIDETLSSSESLETLKKEVSEYIESVQTSMDQHNQKEQVASNKLTFLLKGMQHKIAQLEEQTQAYSEQLRIANLQAQTDKLTNLPNRMACDKAVDSEILTVGNRKNGTALAVFDIDYFKKINDTYGHIAGDKILQSVAQFLQQHVKSPNFVGRWGGEEFLLMFVDTTPEAAATKANDILDKLRQLSFNFNDEKFKITGSLGIGHTFATCPVEMIFAKADIALYKAKMNGRDQVQMG
ncbi:GGDEF domain-containing protein [Opacimonas viscosa]|uniref:diguanylate cyclase n=1 Tax=Opacimonas viscosa TaxID=2961944 RepID=A0AA41WZU8_9ALTE|nr:GGDEF domain-containing protein [Opacimonas viscosa]MCP3427756.1 diguanylate cyclase [Opacimonas viscosa]